MPRWLYITLCLVLFNVVMALIWWGMTMWGAPVLGSFYDQAGSPTAWIIMTAVIGTAAVVGYWPRDPNGRLRLRLSRRR